MRRTLLAYLLILLAFTASALAGNQPVTEGALQIMGKDGPVGFCPLKHTDVKAEISGFLARVEVTQEFWNPSKQKIEAVYVFPLSQRSAVDDMTLQVGDRTVRGIIKRREEAQAIYEAARAAGHVAALLDQERPNIFTQSVANIMPGETVKVTIRYVEFLKYEDGAYEFSFPMVVGPRYIPGSMAIGQQGGGWAPDTNQVPDASRITPPVAGVHTASTRAGHDLSLEVALDAGVPIQDFRSTSHAILWDRTSASSAVIRLKQQAVIPNKDFILRYDVSGGRIEDAVLTHKTPAGKSSLRSTGFFTLILQPPDRIPESEITPKEIVFVLDTSGSMSGFPIEKAKEAMKLALDGLHSEDTFNLITFAGDTQILFPEPVPATPKNLALAQEFLAGRSGSGGTEMMKAIRAALDPSDSQDHLRVVCFMTDGYVGNDMEIIAEVQKHPNARVFSFGIGQSVNRFLLDKMAEVSRGEVEYVGLNDDGSAAARRFHERVRTPLLTDLSIDWNGIPVADIYPARLPDLFSAKPVIVTGRYGVPSRGVIRLKGRRAGEDFVREIRLDLPASESRHDVLASLWARQKIDDLMARDYAGIQQGTARKDVKEEITQLGLDFHLMTQFTSFVAVEEMTVTEDGQPRLIQVPVEMPEGVSPEGVFGKAGEAPYAPASAPVAAKVMRQSGASFNGISSGTAGGSLSTNQPATNGRVTRELKDEEADRASAIRVNRPATWETRLDANLLRVAKCYEMEVTQPLRRGQCKLTGASKLEVEVWLTEKNAASLAKLRALGFEVKLDPKTSKLIIGKVTVAKLGQLARLDVVRYIAPHDPAALSK